jgi:hypothetical protein
VYVVTNSAGTDIYPVGTGELYLFSIFDTGSGLAVISDLPGTAQDDNGYLGIGAPSVTNSNQDTRIRISGLDEVDPTSLWGPINAPGASYGADVELPGIRIGPRNINATLMGAPVTNRVVAEIDGRPASAITRGPYPGGSVTGPDMQFYEPKLPSNPVPTLKLPLAYFGSTTPSALDNATRDQRVFIRNVRFKNGGNEVSDDQTVPAPRQFLFDTGAPPTIISTSMATNLGLSYLSPNLATEDCFTTQAGNEGFVIDEVTFSSFDPTYGGTYTITNAVVCVDITGTRITTNYPNPTPPPGGKLVDAVIGLNLFDHVPILVNLPEGYLGIMPPP